MISKLHLKWLIKNQKISARKAIVNYEMTLNKEAANINKYKILKLISNEKQFISYKFTDDSLNAIMDTVHMLRHSSENNVDACSDCKKVLAEMAIEPTISGQEPDIVNKQDKLKPRFGNLISLLEQEVVDEWNNVEKKRLPSQNDLTRWALKRAVLDFYKNMNLPENTVIVDVLYDDRLTTKLAPDFNAIADLWIKKLDELQRRNDKYSLTLEEYDKADQDLLDGMRGSAFEKQLDRYREEFMSKLMR